MKRASFRRVQNLTVFCKWLEMLFLIELSYLSKNRLFQRPLSLLRTHRAIEKYSFNCGKNIETMQHFGIV